jgi:CRP/FNR family cyclic AMP-dependent transcriptional regulator
MNLNEEVELLKRVPIFAKMEPAKLKLLAFTSERMNFAVPRTATIKAREPLTTLKISKDTFYRMVGEFPTLAIEIMRELAHRVEDTNKKLREATANRAA